ncbi:hypothetical protein FRB98_001659, partial [Tulasnella sp. 332]
MGRTNHLDKIYPKILDRACLTTVDSDLALFQDVLGALLVGQAPLNICTLCSLLCPPRVDEASTERIRAV